MEEMEDLARDSSDEELSIPQFQLNAITEALLADLDPTGTASQDERGVYYKRGHSASRRRPGAKENADAVINARDDGGAGFKAGAAAETVGGDSVSAGPKITSLQKPPRRPRKQVHFETDEVIISERGAKGEEVLGFAPNDSQAAHHELLEHDQLRNGCDDASRQQSPPPRAVESPSPSPQEKPMRRVVVSRHKRGEAKPPSKPRQLPTTAPNVPDSAPAAANTEDERVLADAAAPTRHRKIVVNGISYRILKKLGRGGSGRVYQVLAPDTKAWAFKAIPLGTLDERAMRQIQNEVALLQSLRATERVAYLNDWCVDESKNAIHIVMELGQIDLENIIKDHMEREQKLDPVFAGYYWREMLRCIAAIHAVDVVHSDIKPANFVSINGVLKIVDFGIAHSLPDHTVNVYLDHQAGTPNYMAPETLKILSSSSSEDSASSRCVRFGKPSDMWSLGCVLHLMVYGRQPFAHIRGMAPKLLAIVDPDCVIELERHGLGAVRVPPPLLRTMEACLVREPRRRPTADGLLAGSADGLLQMTTGMEGNFSSGRHRLRRVIGDALAETAPIEVSRRDLDQWVAEAIDAEDWR